MPGRMTRKRNTPVNGGVNSYTARRKMAGEIIHFAGSTPPTGYLVANGQLVSRTTYAALFAAIGSTYGAGDGSTTFAVPDLRGEFVRGADGGRGVDAGRALGSAQTDAMQGHRHLFSWSNTVQLSGGSGLQYDNVTTNTSMVGNGNRVLDATSDGVNGTPRTGLETRPRNVAMLPCIAY